MCHLPWGGFLVQSHWSPLTLNSTSSLNTAEEKKRDTSETKFLMLFIVISPFPITKGCLYPWTAAGYTFFQLSNFVWRYFKRGFFDRTFIKQAGQRATCRSELTALNWINLWWNSFGEVKTSCYWWCCGGMAIWKHIVLFHLKFSDGIHFWGWVKLSGRFKEKLWPSFVWTSRHLCACSCAGWSGVQS